MLYHVSIEADDPRHVAEIFCEFWGGAVAPFPPVGEDSWLAFAGDDRNTMIEIYPRGTELHEAIGDADAVGLRFPRRRHTATHFAVGTPLSETEVMVICAREGWPAKYRKRGGAFGVIEIWIEGCQMIELLTPEMEREYLETMTPAGWAAQLEAARPVPELA